MCTRIFKRLFGLGPWRTYQFESRSTCQQNEAAVAIGSIGPGSPLIKRIVGGLCASNAGFSPLQRFFMKLPDFACAGNPMDTRRNRPAQGGGQ